MRRDVAFPGFDGTILRGWLYQPDATTRVPGIAMAHGFSATRGMGLPGHAAALADAGFAVLLYDHRGLGDSDGEPRQLIDPFVQTRDMGCALDWLALQPEIDAARLGLWGTSYSGGEALVLAGLDPRVRATVGIVPAVGRVGAGEFAALAARVRTAIVQPERTRGPRPVVPAPDAPDALMPDPPTAEWMLREGAACGRWRNAVLTPDWAGVLPFTPALAAPHLAGHALLIAGRDDHLAPAADVEAVAAAAPDRIEARVLEGHHCSFYAGEGLRITAAAACDFFSRRL